MVWHWLKKVLCATRPEEKFKPIAITLGLKLFLSIVGRETLPGWKYADLAKLNPLEAGRAWPK
jgi:hypothetical protein